MKKSKLLLVILSTLLLFVAMTFSFTALAEETDGEVAVVAEETAEDVAETDDAVGTKAIAAAIVVGIAAAGGAIAMGMAIAKSAESMARQPEATGKINSAMMLGLVFIETLIIYALIVAILIIFVL